VQAKAQAIAKAKRHFRSGLGDGLPQRVCGLFSKGRCRKELLTRGQGNFQLPNNRRTIVEDREPWQPKPGGAISYSAFPYFFSFPAEVEQSNGAECRPAHSNQRYPPRPVLGSPPTRDAMQSFSALSQSTDSIGAVWETHETMMHGWLWWPRSAASSGQRISCTFFSFLAHLAERVVL